MYAFITTLRDARSYHDAARRTFSLRRCTCRLLATLAHYTLGIRYRITGDPSALDIAQTGPYVAICNHQSSLDVLSMAALWPRQKLAVIAKESLKMVPVFGTALWAAGRLLLRVNTCYARMT